MKLASERREIAVLVPTGRKAADGLLPAARYDQRAGGITGREQAFREIANLSGRSTERNLAGHIVQRSGKESFGRNAVTLLRRKIAVTTYQISLPKRLATRHGLDLLDRRVDQKAASRELDLERLAAPYIASPARNEERGRLTLDPCRQVGLRKRFFEGHLLFAGHEHTPPFLSFQYVDLRLVLSRRRSRRQDQRPCGQNGRTDYLSCFHRFNTRPVSSVN